MQSKKQFWDSTKPSPYVEQAIAIVSKGLALDLGSGKGRNSFFLLEKGFDVTAVDNDQKAVDSIKLRNKNSLSAVNTYHSDLLKYETDKAFDLIVCSMVLHFLETKEQIELAVTKMQNMTNPSGLNVITALTDKNKIEKRPYLFKTNELINYYAGWEIVLHEEKPTLWFQLPGMSKPRRNQAVYLIARKLL